MLPGETKTGRFPSDARANFDCPAKFISTAPSSCLPREKSPFTIVLNPRSAALQVKLKLHRVGTPYFGSKTMTFGAVVLKTTGERPPAHAVGMLAGSVRN